MAISKIILNGVTQMDVTGVTVQASNLIAPNTAIGADGNQVTGTATATSEFLVTLTYNSTSGMWEPDKTFAQIQAAYNNGDLLLTLSPALTSGQYNETYCRFNSTQSPNSFWYQVSWFDYDDTGLQYVDCYTLTASELTLDDRQTFGIPTTLVEKTITANGTYNPILTDYADGYSLVTVNVPSSGSSMNVQYYMGADSVAAGSYTATDVTLTVSKTGTYKVSWMGWRSTSSGTSGSQLYINGTAYGSANTTFTGNYGQAITLTGVSLTKSDVLVVRARSRNTSYYMYVGNLIIEEQ